MLNKHEFLILRVPWRPPRLGGSTSSHPHILGWLAAGMSNAEILTDFPELIAEDIQAALAFAADREHHLVAASA